MAYQRIRIRFGKRGAIRFISHLDLLRVFERAIRRSNLPIRMTEGFNPHPRISFPLSLAAGVEGLEEVAEIELSQWVSPSAVEASLRPQLPEGIELVSVTIAPPGRPARVVEVEYELLPASGGKDYFAELKPEDIQTLLSRSTIPVKRIPGVHTPSGAKEASSEGREVDIRPYIREIVRTPQGLKLRFKVTPQGTARPQEVLRELGLLSDIPPARFQIIRTRVILESDSTFIT